MADSVAWGIQNLDRDVSGRASFGTKTDLQSRAQLIDGQDDEPSSEKKVNRTLHTTLIVDGGTRHGGTSGHGPKETLVLLVY